MITTVTMIAQMKIWMRSWTKSLNIKIQRIFQQNTKYYKLRYKICARVQYYKIALLLVFSSFLVILECIIVNKCYHFNEKNSDIYVQTNLKKTYDR